MTGYNCQSSQRGGRRGLLSTAAGMAISGLASCFDPCGSVRAAGAGRTAKSVILIFNCGAPSHLDLWDMKPLAAAEIRGPFQPIQTNVPGIEISELLPGLSRRMDRL
ncbi:MAG: DUF1501 domain-containing protein, partial [Planctomyces sp.]